ncbi:MAG: orotidine-5'-phosphate decarboxylase [Burkholderiaceae bacterium]
MSFLTNLNQRWQSADSMLCVGLDPDPERLPQGLRGAADAIFLFCREIVDATADLVCAFKPQIAYFAAIGAERQLDDLIAHIHDRHPGIPVILDAKRGDIGTTARRYAQEAFERYRADAVTVNPYMGTDSLTPWLEWTDRGVFLLCRTSNPGGDDLQAQRMSGGADAAAAPLYARVAELAQTRWNPHGETGLVVGATYPDELAVVRRICPTMPLLVPGIGAQGGDIAATVAAGCRADGAGLLINSSRAILYADAGSRFAEAARAAALATRDAIRAARDDLDIAQPS